MSTANFPGAETLSPAVCDGPWEKTVDPRHVVQFYGDDAFLVDELSKYIGTALAAGDGAVVIATRAHRDGIAQRLIARGMDPARPIAQGRYITLDAAETLAKFMLNGFPDAALFNEAMGSMIVQVTACAEGTSPHVAAFGEMVALLWAQVKIEAALDVEELWNTLARNHSFSLRCVCVSACMTWAGFWILTRSRAVPRLRLRFVSHPTLWREAPRTGLDAGQPAEEGECGIRLQNDRWQMGCFFAPVEWEAT